MVFPWALGLPEVHTKHHHKANGCTATRCHVNAAIRFRCQKHLNMIACTSPGMLMQALLQLLKKKALNAEAEHLGFLDLQISSKVRCKKQSAFLFKSQCGSGQIQPTWVSCYITELDWVNRFTRLRLAREKGASPRMLMPQLSLTHILASISTNQSYMAHSCLVYLPLAGDKV